MGKHRYIPRPLFDGFAQIINLEKQCRQANDMNHIVSIYLKKCIASNKEKLPIYSTIDYQHAVNFLYSYRGSPDTFNAYRRELERLFQWSWFIQKKSVLKLKRADIEAFIEFCQNPYKNWVGTKIVSRFINQEGVRIPNPDWRPFIAKISKKKFQDGYRAIKSDLELSQTGLRVLFNIISSFYNYLLQEEATEINPVLQIRQKSKFIRKKQSSPVIRRLSDVQWNAVINTALKLAENNPERHERTLFIMNVLYGMYLRISELTANKKWTPKMNDFFRDLNGTWWFRTVGKGNKERQIAVSDAMLKALKRWRQHLGLTVLPSPDEQSPIFPKAIGKGPIKNTSSIRNIVQVCFNQAVEELRKQKLNEEAEMLRAATVHWLRHTGISDDVKIRPREHVRDDAGHSSGAITDRYINIELQERAKSAKKKTIMREKEN